MGKVPSWLVFWLRWRKFSIAFCCCRRVYYDSGDINFFANLEIAFVFKSRGLSNIPFFVVIDRMLRNNRNQCCCCKRCQEWNGRIF